MHKLNYLQHREEKVASDLALIAGLLSNSRENGTIGDMGASYNTPGSMKLASKTMTAKMSTTSMMRRTARSKCKLLPAPLAGLSSKYCVALCVLFGCLLPQCAECTACSQIKQRPCCCAWTIAWSVCVSVSVCLSGLSCVCLILI